MHTLHMHRTSTISDIAEGLRRFASPRETRIWVFSSAMDSGGQKLLVIKRLHTKQQQLEVLVMNRINPQLCFLLLKKKIHWRCIREIILFVEKLGHIYTNWRN